MDICNEKYSCPVFDLKKGYQKMDRNEVLTDPKKLVRLELQNAGFDWDKISIPKRVYLLADDIFDAMLARNCGEYRYPLGGDLYVFHSNQNVGFVKSNMCSAGIATQAEDLIAGGVEELIHIGYAGGIQPDMKVGDIILTDGAFNDTAVARLYGYDVDRIESTSALTDRTETLLEDYAIDFRRGSHWTTDAGYRETWGQILDYRDHGALCVEMEGAGLFTIAQYRNVSATAIYIVSDVLNEAGWSLGWNESKIGSSLEKLLHTIILSVPLSI